MIECEHDQESQVVHEVLVCQNVGRIEVVVQRGHDGMTRSPAVQAETLFRSEKAPDDHHHFLQCVLVGIAPWSVTGSSQLLLHAYHDVQTCPKGKKDYSDNTSGPGGELIGGQLQHVVGTGYQLVQGFVTPSDTVVQVESVGKGFGVWPYVLMRPFSRLEIWVLETTSQPSSPDSSEDCSAANYATRYGE